MTKNPTKNQFIDIDNARVEEQVQVMTNIMVNAECPFCLENLRKYHKEPILKEGKYWLLTKNQWPYQYTSLHLLAIYKSHVVDLQDIEPAAGVELLELMTWAVKKFQVPGGGWAMRFGDSDYSAGTVNHIHAQLLVPDIQNPDYDTHPVKVTIGKTWAKRNKGG